MTPITLMAAASIGGSIMLRPLHISSLFLAAIVLGTAALAAEPTGREIDLLAPLAKPDAGGVWKAFHEGDAKLADVWKLDDGVLTCKGTPKGYLYTTKNYTDFILKLEWRWPPQGKGGQRRRVAPHHGQGQDLAQEPGGPDQRRPGGRLLGPRRLCARRPRRAAQDGRQPAVRQADEPQEDRGRREDARRVEPIRDHRRRATPSP